MWGWELKSSRGPWCRTMTIGGAKVPSVGQPVSTQMLSSELHKDPTPARGSPHRLSLLCILFLPTSFTIIIFFETDRNKARTKALKTREVSDF